MRGLVGAVVVGLLAGCGGVDADVDASLVEQRFELQPCHMLERGVCSDGATAYCIDNVGKKLSCSCTYMGSWSCVE